MEINLHEIDLPKNDLFANHLYGAILPKSNLRVNPIWLNRVYAPIPFIQITN